MKRSKSGHLDWWRKARFGLFIHWGLYSVAAGRWKGKFVPQLGEWIMASAKIPLKEYRKLANGFTGENFDADAIVKLAKRAGMGHIVLTAKHHEGFALYDSKVSDYTSVKMTPSKRDYVKELAKACKRGGLKLCLYYSQAVDFEHPGGSRNDWDYKPEEKDFDAYMNEKALPQLQEILTNYGPVGLIWFDVPAYLKDGDLYVDKIIKLVKRIQPDCIVSGRVGCYRGEYGALGDNEVTAGPVKGDWETPFTMNHTWGFKKDDKDWKSTKELLQLMASLTGKGVNSLLNIGPDKTGRIPAPSLKCLKEIGDWMAVYQDAIVGTQAGPFPHDFSWGNMTVKDNRLYLMFTEWKGGAFTLTGLKNAVKNAYLMNAPKAKLMVGQIKCPKLGCIAVTLQLPKAKPDKFMPVVVLEMDGAPKAVQVPVQQSTGEIRLPAHMASSHGIASSKAKKSGKQKEEKGLPMAVAAEMVTQEYRDHLHIGAGGVVSGWKDTAEWLDWRFSVDTPGRMRVLVHTVSEKYQPWHGGHVVEVSACGKTVKKTLKEDGKVSSPRAHVYPEVYSNLGTIELTETGKCTLSIKASKILKSRPEGLRLGEIRLIPA